MNRVLNFYPGPSALPLDTLKSAKEELINWRGSGMSVLEISHRSKVYDELHNETKAMIRELFGVPENYEILMLQGGASLQFAMIPMNFLRDNESADYIVTGRFSNNAFKTACKVGNIRLCLSTEENGKYFRIPGREECTIDPGAVYCHITSNNTISGTQWKKFPFTGQTPIIADMSSDILSRRIDFTPFGLLYAGAQKNLGPAGVTVVIIRDDLVQRSRKDLPDVLSYRVHVSKNSLYNTPSCFGVYMMHKVLEWIKEIGGLDVIEKRNEEKAKLIYGVIDKNHDFFISRVERESRSSMNVTFNLPKDELEELFISEAQNEGIIGLKGHRSVGGIRVSMYNSHGVDDIRVLVQFMENFLQRNG